ncbi:MAG TPA: SAM-dependent methyltransferase [Steroidobacteraceae bacterium]
MLASLSDAEREHSAALARVIRTRIAEAGGWLPFDAFMDLALYAPGLGYYSAGAVKLGVGGDFATAPEMSQLFGQCLARQCAQILSATGGGILELGAGTGSMAVTVLEALAELGVLPDQYSILEVSADLAARQRGRLEALPAPLRERVTWIERLPPTPMRGVVLANEVLDALPCARFVVHAKRVRALGVAVDADGGFIEREGFADELLARHAEALVRELKLADGYRSELCWRVEPWLAGVGECLKTGTILLFDYGLPRTHYYHPQRTDGTLRCHFKHRAHNDPFILAGVQDISAWVDFTRVAEAADAAGLGLSGFTTQAAFLLGSGMEEVLGAAADEMTRARRAGEAVRLLLPGEMGEAFKVMALCRDFDEPLRGFALQDLRASL